MRIFVEGLGICFFKIAAISGVTYANCFKLFFTPELVRFSAIDLKNPFFAVSAFKKLYLPVNQSTAVTFICVDLVEQKH